ncbi:hypothetical protein SSX86_025137 [Deinandra increscens subsp. villosa]|uniref:Uncharacterized protein n=1 Tax=Deinandra increscens subsp. villosa TaxID=3103831 RepID=A0AAP0GLR8_9ASTR
MRRMSILPPDSPTSSESSDDALPSINITPLRAEVIGELDYTPSYKKVWAGKQKAIEQVFENWEESYMLYHVLLIF